MARRTRPAPDPSTLRRSTRLRRPPPTFPVSAISPIPHLRRPATSPRRTPTDNGPAGTYEMRLVYNLTSSQPGNPYRARFIRDPDNQLDTSRGVTQLVVYVDTRMPLRECVGRKPNVADVVLMGEENEEVRMKRVLAELVEEEDSEEDWEELDRQLEEMVEDSEDEIERV